MNTFSTFLFALALMMSAKVLAKFPYLLSVRALLALTED
jgi:hypothetical protein